jgi:excisionase family DNA binding protein
MSGSRPITSRLNDVARRLGERGETELEREVESIIAELDRAKAPPLGLMTTGEAARELGVRSVFTIKRWAREGILEGFRRGGRILITRESVERLAQGPKVADERARDAQLVSALEAFDAGDEPVPPTSWPGRKPWVTRESTET